MCDSDISGECKLEVGPSWEDRAWKVLQTVHNFVVSIGDAVGECARDLTNQLVEYHFVAEIVGN